jgi:hypothetical protein
MYMYIKKLISSLSLLACCSFLPSKEAQSSIFNRENFSLKLETGVSKALPYSGSSGPDDLWDGATSSPGFAGSIYIEKDLSDRLSVHAKYGFGNFKFKNIPINFSNTGILDGGINEQVPVIYLAVAKHNVQHKNFMLGFSYDLHQSDYEIIPYIQVSAGLSTNKTLLNSYRDYSVQRITSDQERNGINSTKFGYEIGFGVKIPLNKLSDNKTTLNLVVKYFDYSNSQTDQNMKLSELQANGIPRKIEQITTIVKDSGGGIKIKGINVSLGLKVKI